MKKYLSLIILFLMVSPCFAYLTAGKVAVTATSSSSGVSSTSQDSDISDAVGTNVTVGVPVAVTGNMNITGTYQVNGSPISATSNWNLSGNTINYIAGNVGISSITPGQMLDIQGTVRALGGIFSTNSLNSTGINWTSIDNYGSSGSAFTPSSNLKIAYGSITASSSASTTQITNLPFTSSTSYIVTTAPFADGSGITCTVQNTSVTASSFYLFSSTNATVCNWIAVGY